jgi:hypothetical protein
MSPIFMVLAREHLQELTDLKLWKRFINAFHAEQSDLVLGG